MKLATILITLVCILFYAISVISAAPAHRRRAGGREVSNGNSYKTRNARTTLTTSLTTKKAATTTSTKSKPTITTTKAATVTKVPVSNVATSSSGTYSGDGTYYDVGLGSCGQTNSNSEYVAALNAPQMANGDNPNKNPQCGKKIKVINPANKKSVTVTIVDTCPPCAFGSVDLSPSAFGAIADLSLGRIPIEWSYV